MPDPEPLLRTERLARHFGIGRSLSRRTLYAVDDVSIDIGEREIVALVGESGSGKSTIARLLAKTSKPTTGEIYFQGRPLSGIRSHKDLLAYRRMVPMVFQDPFSSINPVYRVSHGILRALKLHRPELNAAQRRARAIEAFEIVGLVPATEILQRFPHELSGGQRQRVGVRPGTGHAAEAHPGRRASLHAGRLDPDRPAQPDGHNA
jgi:peptide/nickel transport system ATP-binding protein